MPPYRIRASERPRLFNQPIAEPAVLITFVALYLLVTIASAWWPRAGSTASRDYMVAGRSLPLYMNVATVFATWFGAETVLSVSATFAKDGLGGIPATRSAPRSAWCWPRCCSRACSTG
jgi:Na+(H+)/acetate symporter ActP